MTSFPWCFSTGRIRMFSLQSTAGISSWTRWNGKAGTTPPWVTSTWITSFLDLCKSARTQEDSLKRYRDISSHRGSRVEQWHSWNSIRYYVDYLGDKIICTPNPYDMQFTHVTNLHMYPLNLKAGKKKTNKTQVCIKYPWCTRCGTMR